MASQKWGSALHQRDLQRQAKDEGAIQHDAISRAKSCATTTTLNSASNPSTLTEPYIRVAEPLRSEGQSTYRAFWRSKQAIPSRYLDHKLLEARQAPVDLLVTLNCCAAEFDSADQDGSGGVDFDEFCKLCEMKDARLGSSSGNERTSAELLEWFNILDQDGDGRVSKPDYFAFAIREAMWAAGTNANRGLQAIFAGYDRDNSGQLSRSEVGPHTQIVTLTITLILTLTIITIAYHHHHHHHTNPTPTPVPEGCHRDGLRRCR